MSVLSSLRSIHHVTGLTRGGWTSSLKSRSLFYSTNCGGNVKPVCGDGQKSLKRVTLIEGRGSGPSICASVRKIFKAAEVPVEWVRHTVRVRRDLHTGKFIINPEALQSAIETGVVLRGPDTAGNSMDDHGSSLLTLQKVLDASIGVRLFKSVEGHQPYGHVRMVNIRDTVSGEYTEIEHTVVPGVVQSIKTVTRTRSEAVARFAFDYALQHGHCRVTALHKANVMRLTDGTFLQACRRVSADYPNVDYCEERLDKFCLVVTNDHSRYDILLTPSLYGSLASAACSTLAGGAAMVPTVAYGNRMAVFGTMADDGTGCEHYIRCGGGNGNVNVIDHVSDRYRVANPTGLIRSAAWMLHHMGMTDDGLRISSALYKTIKEGVRTQDMGGTASCIQFTDAIIKNMLMADRNTCPPST